MYHDLRVGILLIILACSFAAASADERVHILQQGETIYAISQKYHVPADSIIALNRITDPSKLRSGQKIRIPDLYIVEKGDTLYGIARKKGVSFESLITANGLEKNSLLKVGQQLYIPGSASTQSGDSALSREQPTNTTVPDNTAATKLIFEDPRGFETKPLDSSIIWPVTARQVSYLSGKVYGVSIVGAKGENVKAVASGTVVSTGPYRGFGQVVFVQSGSGYIYVYGGLDSNLPAQGTAMAFGDSVGTLGSDSLSGKPLLYFMVYNKDKPVDPAKAPRGH